MQLREAPNGPGREMHHVQRLLAKAVKHSTLLEALCAARADDRSALEAEAYSAWLCGNMALEREDWDTALAKLSRCRTVYDELSKAAEGPDQALYKKRVEEIDPSIRYCKYNVARQGGATDLAEEELLQIGKTSAGVGNEMLKAKLEKSLAQTRKEKAEAVGAVEWLGQSVPVANATTHQHILTAEGSQKELESAETFEEKMQIYDKLFMALEDAKKQIRDDVSDQLKQGDAGEEAAVAQLQTLRTYVQSRTLLSTRDRDLLLVENVQEKLAARTKDAAGRKAPRPENLVKMFESLLAGNEEWAQLPGIEGDAGLSKVSAARSLMYKGWRILYLAQSYKQQRQLPEALALVERVQQLAKVAAQRFAETPAMDQVDKTWVGRLQEQVRLSRVEVQSEAVLQQAAGPAHPAQSSDTLKQLAATPLSARLNNYDAAVYGDAGKAPKLVDFPPPIEAVACKPALFDLALNKALYPDVSARATKKKAGGLLSWFSRS